jgi:hypothetical protein
LPLDKVGTIIFLDVDIGLNLVLAVGDESVE